MSLFEKLPQGLMEEVIWRTSHVDACRLSLVSKTFRSAAESDVVWDKFLPSDYQQLLSSLPKITFASKKDLYLFLIGNVLPLHHSPTRCWLDKWSGKKCFVSDVSVIQQYNVYHNAQPRTYKYSARFVNALYCYDMTRLGIEAKMSTSMLSPDTVYMSYLVFVFEEDNSSLFDIPVEVCIRIQGEETVSRIAHLRNIIADKDPRVSALSSRTTGHLYPHEYSRLQEGEFDTYWLELELGECFNNKEDAVDNKNMEINVTEVESTGRSRNDINLRILGIEIRPKGDRKRDA